MKITRDRSVGKLFLFQQAYVENVLKRFNMNNAKPVTVSFAAHFKLSADMLPKTDEKMEHIVVSRYVACLGKEHWQAVKWILRCLKGTTNVGLTFDRAKMSDSVVGYVDSNFAGDVDKKRSLTGYLFTLSRSAIS
ncbi:hypothetical protein GH714_025996 [Hevea brasiliensis]|uniref:Reverse transcriptase Ty1/copia-type domain-containing protein n=1 Tax=Hevea brasiliensis TaxID=3981 RepID=A0A6A6KU78_HEVBR|nr:hypothetical protein GH714_025996 [Hevea brasiliensis]